MFAPDTNLLVIRCMTPFIIMYRETNVEISDN